jgi:hypothetical protein
VSILCISVWRRFHQVLSIVNSLAVAEAVIS